MSDRKVPRFGSPVTNVYASDRNPHKRGFFVRQGTRTGRLNPGIYWQVTDGKGDFWQGPPDAYEIDTSPATPMVQVDAVEAGARAMEPMTFMVYDQVQSGEYNPAPGYGEIVAKVETCRRYSQACLSAALPVLLARIDELEGKVELIEVENGRLREALGNISRMRTMPDHKTNTFTLVMAHKLAEQVLHRDIVDEMEIAKGSVL